jgi:hypothetical protein
MMIMSAGMFMKEAGLVPSIIELSSRAPNAHPIPIAVEAFIATLIGCGKKILESAAGLPKRGGRAAAGSQQTKLGRDPSIVS